MLDAEDILNGLLRGAIGGRRRPWRRTHRALRGGGLINARTLLGAAGVAWGLFETWQRQQATRTTAPAPEGTVAAPPPLPGAPPPPAPAGEEGALPPVILRLMRLMISAARADGEIGPAERERILTEAREVGAGDVVAREIDSPRPLAEIVADVDDPELKEQLYALAFTIVRADEAVAGSERIYLAQLAHRLGLPAEAVARLEAETARRIDAAEPQD